MITRRIPNGFLEWCRTPRSRDAFDKKINFAEWLMRNNLDPNSAEATKILAEEINADIVAGNSVYLNCNQAFDLRLTLEIGASDKSIALAEARIDVAAATGPIVLRNLRCKYLFLTGRADAGVAAYNCWIGEIHAGQNSYSRLALYDSWIGKLVMTEVNCLGDVILMRGGVLSIQCPNPQGPQPLAGAFVVSRRTYLPSKPIDGFIGNPQPYRNLHSKLVAVGNHNSAGLIRRREETFERRYDSWSDKIFSCLYQAFSDFGSSTARPLIWITALFALNLAAIILCDGAAIAQDESYYKNGWRQLLLQTDFVGRLSRSVVLALDPITNPLGVFSGRTILLANSWPLALWLAFSGIASAVLLALFVFALRRRFKIP